MRAPPGAPRGTQGAPPLPVRRPWDRRGPAGGRRGRQLHAGRESRSRSRSSLSLRPRDRRASRIRPWPARRRLGRALCAGRLRAAPPERLAWARLAALRPHPLPYPGRGCERTGDPGRQGRVRRLLRGRLPGRKAPPLARAGLPNRPSCELERVSRLDGGGAAPRDRRSARLTLAALAQRHARGARPPPPGRPGLRAAPSGSRPPCGCGRRRRCRCRPSGSARPAGECRRGSG